MQDLKHLYSYTAVYEDGTVIEMDRNDPKGDACLSRTDGTGSRFTDVQEKEKESKLISFVIHNDEVSLGVDLVDGHFEVNGIPIWQHRPDLTNYTDFRVIYYRTVERVINQADGEEVESNILGYTVGWQTTYDGENVKRETRI